MRRWEAGVHVGVRSVKNGGGSLYGRLSCDATVYSCGTRIMTEGRKVQEHKILGDERRLQNAEKFRKNLFADRRFIYMQVSFSADKILQRYL